MNLSNGALCLHEASPQGEMVARVMAVTAVFHVIISYLADISMLQL